MNTGEARAVTARILAFTGLDVDGIYLAEKMTDGTIILIPAAGARVPLRPLAGKDGEAGSGPLLPLRYATSRLLTGTFLVR